MLYYQILVSATHGKNRSFRKIKKKFYENDKPKISARWRWDEEFELPNGNSVSDIQDYSHCNFKKHETLTDKPRI